MATTAMSSLTTQELHHFHKTDRRLFCFLIFKLRRDITESLLVMALWLWLEHIGYPNLIHAIIKLQNQPKLVEAMVDEAAACLMCLLDIENSNDQKSNGDGDGNGYCKGLVLMKKLIQRDISIRIFHERRYTALAGIKSILKNICSKIFFDILHDNKNILLKRNNNNNNNNNNNYKNGRVVVRTSQKTTPNNNSYTFPGFLPPSFDDIIDMLTRAPPEEAIAEASSNHGLLHEKIWDRKKPSDDVSKEDRTMFLTFSRGYPVTEKEVRELFGDECVESVNMGGCGNDGRQNLYAVMVLKEVATVDQILKGKKMTKLHINGKHIWTRKFEYRHSYP
ncbi:hypothetical protein PIB30_012604 [Stylosanthes scabra]|uniref:RRM domain-containing protein n=1 Tax=Stylosanthes scabra TaxID=79078 RepID=A0ABU6X4C6_9FABA|nr:hypothetical protein [Stylosanthes scabra]